jgi:YggT family protein
VHSLITVVRYSVFGAFVVALVAATGSWLVRTRRVSPFSGLGRSLRSVSDVVIAPVERRVVRRGGNPVHAGIWLVIVVAAAGVLLIAVLEWLQSVILTARLRFHQGPWGIYHFAVGFAYSVLMVALLLRVIGTWFGVFEHTAWMRPAYWLTDWIVKPIRRVLPPLGNLDVSPIVAWLALWILKNVLMSIP